LRVGARDKGEEEDQGMTGQRSTSGVAPGARLRGSNRHARRITFALALLALALAPRVDAGAPTWPPGSVSHAAAPPPLPALPPEQPPAGSQFRPDLARRDRPNPPRPGEPPVPSVAIRVRVPAEAAPGRELTYRMTAENCSRAAAHHVIVRVPLPEGARFVRAAPTPTEEGPILAWTLGTLAPCAKRELTLVVVPEGPSPLTCCARVQFEHGQCVRTRILRGARPAPPPAPASVAALRMRKEGPKLAARYDILSFRLVVANTGRATARGVVVEDTLPKGLDFLTSKPSTTGDNPLVWKLGDLPANSSRVIEYQAVAKEVGSLTSSSVIRAEGGLRRESTHTLRIGQPSLSVVKVGPRQRLVGRPATYVITVTNTGSLPATNVQLSDELPPLDEKKKPSGLAFVGATEGGRREGNHVRWNVGTLVAGEKRTVQLTMRATRAGKFENVCTATADRGLTEQARAETSFEDLAALSLELERDRVSVAAGQEATFTVRVYNGQKAAQTNLSVVATLPEGLKLLDVNGPTGSTTEGRKVRFPLVASLPARGERVATLRVRALAAGDQHFRVQVVTDATGPDKPVTAEETLPVTARPAPASAKPTRTYHRAAFKAAG
jgi:uncharacterized repeat protein (TIGR01451 family)